MVLFLISEAAVIIRGKKNCETIVKNTIPLHILGL